MHPFEEKKAQFIKEWRGLQYAEPHFSLSMLYSAEKLSAHDPELAYLIVAEAAKAPKTHEVARYYSKLMGKAYNFSDPYCREHLTADERLTLTECFSVSSFAWHVQGTVVKFIENRKALSKAPSSWVLQLSVVELAPENMNESFYEVPDSFYSLLVYR